MAGFLPRRDDWITSAGRLEPTAVPRARLLASCCRLAGVDCGGREGAANGFGRVALDTGGHAHRPRKQDLVPAHLSRAGGDAGLEELRAAMLPDLARRGRVVESLHT